MRLTEHLLVCLIEESAEVQQRATKALRFGLTEVQDGQTESNALRIVRELYDIVAVVQLLEECGALPSVGLHLDHDPFAHAEVAAKKQKLARWMRYSRDVGALDIGERL